MTFSPDEEAVIDALIESAKTGNSVIIYWPLNCDKTRPLKEVERRLEDK